jgi:hypothetical protein
MEHLWRLLKVSSMERCSVGNSPVRSSLSRAGPRRDGARRDHGDRRSVSYPAGSRAGRRTSRSRLATARAEGPRWWRATLSTSGSPSYPARPANAVVQIEVAGGEAGAAAGGARALDLHPVLLLFHAARLRTSGWTGPLVSWPPRARLHVELPSPPWATRTAKGGPHGFDERRSRSSLEMFWRG